MSNLILQEFQKKNLKKVPALEAGMTVRVHQKIKEGEKERIQIFEGLVIKVSHGHAVDKTFMVRRVVEGVGVEKIFALYSPNIQKIEITKKSKVRRAKLYYMRNRFGKSARLKGRLLTDEEKDKEMEESAAELAKQVEAEEARKKAEEAKAGGETPETPAETPTEEK